MRIAYIISAYQHPEQLVRLILRLYTPMDIFLVHVDKRTDDRIFSEMVEGVSRLPNVTFLPRHACFWGDFGHVKATLKGIFRIKSQNLPFEWAVLLTGQDYPLKSNDTIKKFLEENSGKSFMAYFPLPSNEWQGKGGLERIESWHFRLGHRKFCFPDTNRSTSLTPPGAWRKFSSLVPKRKFPAGFQPYGGSSYWCLSRECVDYIYHFVRKQPAFVRFFKYVDVPDEIFFQTILLNSPLRESVINDDLRYIDWKVPDSGSPSILGEHDFPKLAASPKLFARKFDIEVEPGILDMIDRYLLGITETARV